MQLHLLKIVQSEVRIKLCKLSDEELYSILFYIKIYHLDGSYVTIVYVVYE